MNVLKSRPGRIGLAAVLVALLVGAVAVVNFAPAANRYTIVSYFKTSNGIYVGDDVVVHRV